MPFTYPSISPADLGLLRQFDTPTVCNVIELFKIRPQTQGYMNGTIRACFPRMPPMVGYASTATFRSAFSPRAGNVYGSLAEQVGSFADLPGPAVVVFQDLDTPPAAATFGEVMCSTYKAFGASGLITNGAGRDLDQVDALGFPCFTGGTICSHGDCHFVHFNVPIHVGGLGVHPGDLLHGDRNGVTNIPIEIASAVAQACPEFMAAEAVVLDYLRGSRVDEAGFRASHKECRTRIEVLGRKLKEAF
jgi:regulator of RNase E activity RraA